MRPDRAPTGSPFSTDIHTYYFRITQRPTKMHGKGLQVGALMSIWQRRAGGLILLTIIWALTWQHCRNAHITSTPMVPIFFLSPRPLANIFCRPPAFLKLNMFLTVDTVLPTLIGFTVE